MTIEELIDILEKRLKFVNSICMKDNADALQAIALASAELRELKRELYVKSVRTNRGNDLG